MSPARTVLLALLPACLVDRDLYEQRRAELLATSEDDTGLVDHDGDGSPAGEDCDDSDPEVNPDATEWCNDIDDDCDDEVDDGYEVRTWYRDDDGDRWGVEGAAQQDCAAPQGYVEQAGDCDDADANVNPDAVDAPDGVDDNCNGTVDVGTLTDIARSWVGQTPHGQAGTMVDLADIDGDGSVDLLVGAPGDADRSDDEPAVYLVTSAIDQGGLLADADAILYGEPDTLFGWALAMAETSDQASLAVAAPAASVDGSTGGTVSLFHQDGGGEFYLAATISPSAAANSGFGNSAERLGDWDGDGIEDFGFGDHAARVGELQGAGVIYIVPANASDGTVADQSIATVYGVIQQAHFGRSFAGGADVNGDGVIDLVSAACDAYDRTGVGYLLLGGDKGDLLASESATTFTSDAEEGQLGYSVRLLDDLDRDELAETVFGQPALDDSPGGRVMVFQGYTDGTLNVHEADWSFTGPTANQRLGEYIGSSTEPSLYVIGWPKAAEPTSESGGVFLIRTWEPDQREGRTDFSFYSGDSETEAAGYSATLRQNCLAVGAPGYDSVETDSGRVLVTCGLQ